MGATLLSSLKAYRCQGDREMIYTLITNTAESNLHPIQYHHWPIAVGWKYQVVKTICNMAADVYSGMLKWRSNSWGQDGSSSEFVIYGENVLKRAIETAEPIPEIDYYNIIYFKDDDPCADIFANFERIDGFKIRNFYGEKVLQKECPTVLDLNIAFQIRNHYESCLKSAQKRESPDIAKLRDDLYSYASLFPEEFRNSFKAA